MVHLNLIAHHEKRLSTEHKNKSLFCGVFVMRHRNYGTVILPQIARHPENQIPLSSPYLRPNPEQKPLFPTDVSPPPHRNLPAPNGSRSAADADDPDPPPQALSARASLSAAECLNPCPEHADATISPGLVSSTTNPPSGVTVYMHAIDLNARDETPPSRRSTCRS